MADLQVVFGTGSLGRWTADALVKLGKPVRMINRSGKMVDSPAGVELVAGDAFDAESNVQLTKGAAAIYQCAQPPYYDWANKFPAMQRAIMLAAAVNDAKFIVGDNLYMYGHFTGSLREDSPIRPDTKKGAIRAAMAQEVLAAFDSGKVQGAIGRASNFFGPYDNTLTGYAMLPAAQGKTVNLLGNIHQLHTFSYIKDFGRLLATLGTRSELPGQVWFTPSNPALTQAELLALIETDLGRPAKKMVANTFILRLLGLRDKTIAETVEMMYEWNNPFVVDSSHAEQVLGLKATPMKQAIHETMDWCRNQVGPLGA